MKVLPMLVGTHADVEYFLAEYPLLNDKLYVLWDGAPQPVVRQFQILVGEHLQNEQWETDLLICGQCRTPFERGVYVCLGCKGTIVYGPTEAERLQARQLGIMGAALFFMALFILIPNALQRLLELAVPDILGLSVFPLLDASVVLLGVSVALSVVIGLIWEWRSSKSKSHLVRTFR